MPFALIRSQDTGEWDVTALCGDRVDQGRLTIQRVGGTSWLMAENLRIAKNHTSSVLDLLPQQSLPVGMRPPRSRWQNVLTGAGQNRRLAVSTTGWVPLYNSPIIGDLLHFTWSWPTPGQMPTSMPGVKL